MTAVSGEPRLKDTFRPARRPPTAERWRRRLDEEWRRRRPRTSSRAHARAFWSEKRHSTASMRLPRAPELEDLAAGVDHQRLAPELPLRPRQDRVQHGELLPVAAAHVAVAAAEAVVNVRLDDPVAVGRLIETHWPMPRLKTSAPGFQPVLPVLLVNVQEFADPAERDLQRLLHPAGHRIPSGHSSAPGPPAAGQSAPRC